MQASLERPAVFWDGRTHSYGEFIQEVEAWRRILEEKKIGEGFVCAVYGDYSFKTTSLLFALILERAILVPLTRAIENEIQKLSGIAGVEGIFRFQSNNTDWEYQTVTGHPTSSLVSAFRQEKLPGLIVFSSGSTGEPKGILQNVERVMHKFVTVRRGWRTVLFLMMDHFGGFNTFLSTFAYGGMAVCLPDRMPASVCKTITESQATLLPTTPTFLNLLLSSFSYTHFDLSSIQLITYGTEVMNAATLAKMRSAFPNAQLKQTYGLSELGVLRSQSEKDDSVWIKIGGDGFEVRIVDHTLWIRSEANMVGYLNAPQPFDSEGWMCTGDQVEVRGEYMRILGRQSDMINVGGQKVFPAEVENVLLQAENVKEAVVVGEKHAILGHIVTARILTKGEEDPHALTARLRKHCLEKLSKYKVPVRFTFVNEEQIRSERFKKTRKETPTRLGATP